MKNDLEPSVRFRRVDPVENLDGGGPDEGKDELMNGEMS